MSRRVPDMENHADLRGAEAGLQGLAGDEFEALVLAELESLRKERYGEQPDPSLRIEQIQQLRERRLEIEQRIEGLRKELAEAPPILRRPDLLPFAVLLLALGGAWALLFSAGYGGNPVGWAGAVALFAAITMVNPGAAFSRAVIAVRYLLSLAAARSLTRQENSLQQQRRRDAEQNNLGEIWKAEQLAILLGRFRLQRIRGDRAAGNPPQEAVYEEQ